MRRVAHPLAWCAFMGACLAIVSGCFRVEDAPEPTSPEVEHGEPADSLPRINVIWILLDACRAGNLSCYGYERPTTPRIDAGIAAGKVVMTLHLNYLDYAAIHEQMADVDTVFWAIGTSSVGVDEETYGRIHVDFPVRFVTEWLDVGNDAAKSFHYISSSDISADSRMMWAREKVRAENSLFDLAEGTNLRVIAYRPDYIGPTREEAHLGQNLLFWFFAPVGAAVKARQIGQAMIEVTAVNGT